MTKLIFGCGYLGLRVATRWRQAGHAVAAVTRSSARALELQSLALQPIVADVTQPTTLQNLPAADGVLYAVGFDRGAGKTMREVYVEGLRHVLEALPPETGRFVYVSSTGVYGQSQGEWVDEDSPCTPTREGGQACLEAERLLQAHPRGRNAVILRMGGIYGPGRIPRRAELLGGGPIAAPVEGYLNLIHGDDAARVILAAESRGPAGSLFNVTDGHPVVRGNYFRELARLVGAPPPQFTPPPETDPRGQRAGGDKRVSNRRLVGALQPDFDFPSYREGLAAILAAE